jgi:hypothetical protein
MPTFANFHVHPKGHDANNGAPSTSQNNAIGNSLGDTSAVNKIYNATGQAIQMYVMSRFGLSMYDPTTKQTTQLRKGLVLKLWVSPNVTRALAFSLAILCFRALAELSRSVRSCSVYPLMPTR